MAHGTRKKQRKQLDRLFSQSKRPSLKNIVAALYNREIHCDDLPGKRSYTHLGRFFNGSDTGLREIFYWLFQTDYFNHCTLLCTSPNGQEMMKRTYSSYYLAEGIIQLARLVAGSPKSHLVNLEYFSFGRNISSSVERLQMLLEEGFGFPGIPSSAFEAHYTIQLTKQANGHYLISQPEWMLQILDGKVRKQANKIYRYVIRKGGSHALAQGLVDLLGPNFDRLMDRDFSQSMLHFLVLHFAEGHPQLKMMVLYMLLKRKENASYGLKGRTRRSFLRQFCDYQLQFKYLLGSMASLRVNKLNAYQILYAFKFIMSYIF